MSIKYNGGYIPAVGADGQILVADSSTSTGLRYNPTSAAGKNAIINGSMDFWQRGTSFSIAASTAQYTADRWVAYFSNTGTITQETSVIPSNSKYAIRLTATATSMGNNIYQLIETNNALPYAGKAITISVQLAGTVGINTAVTLAYSTSVDDTLTNTSTSISLTTVVAPTLSNSLQTYVFTGTVPSNAKTLRVGVSAQQVNTNYLVVANVQLELGSTATTFSRAGGSIGKELALCQRYCQSLNVLNPNGTNGAFLVMGGGVGPGSATEFIIPLKVTMRITPNLLSYLAIYVSNGYMGSYAATLTISNQSTSDSLVLMGGVAGTLGSVYWLMTNSATASNIIWSAEL